MLKLIEADEYEIDDMYSEANVIVINSETLQRHNFHDEGDEDWVKFYGVIPEGESSFPYIIRVRNPGVNCNAVIELYEEDGITLIDSRDFSEEGEEEFLSFNCDEEGLYYVKIRNSNQDVFGEGTHYDLQIDNGAASGPLVLITGWIKDQISWEGIPGAFIRTDGGGSSISTELGYYDLYQTPGDWMLMAHKYGYGTQTKQISIGEGDPPRTENIPLVPTFTSTTTTAPITTSTTAPITTSTTAPITTSTSIGTSSTTTSCILGDPCCIELTYGEGSEETKIIRYIRDNILKQTPEGQEIIKLYYELSPTIIKAMEQDEEFKAEVKEMIDGVLGMIGQ